MLPQNSFFPICNKKICFIGFGIILLLFCLLMYPMIQNPSKRHLQLDDDKSVGNEILEKIIDRVIGTMSSLINVLRRILVLTAMLFLIQNLINFWVLTSSYIFLSSQLPTYFSQTIHNIYTQYNQQFLSYIGIDISYPHFTLSNSKYQNQKYKQYLEFNIARYMLEPVLLLIITIIILIILSAVIAWIKKKVRSKREVFIQQAVEVEMEKYKRREYSKVREEDINGQVGVKNVLNNQEKQDHQSFVFKLITRVFKNNKVENSNQLYQQLSKPEAQLHKKTIQNNQISTTNLIFQKIMDLSINAYEKNLRRRIQKNTKKHWSESIHINKMDIIAALIINYMSGVLLPSYCLIIGNKITSFQEKYNMMAYYLLLGVMLAFPSLYLAVSFMKKSLKKKKDQRWLKDSEIQTLLQYFTNFSISLSIGIRISPLPFLIVTFLMLSLILVEAFASGPTSQISCKSLTFSKVNKIIHKLTFWLYHMVFTFMFICIKIQLPGEDYPLLNSLAYYCGLACLGLFILGGGHQLIQFFLISAYTFFQILWMLCEAVSKKEYQAEQEHEFTKGRPKIKKQDEDKLKMKQKIEEMSEIQLSQNEKIRNSKHQSQAVNILANVFDKMASNSSKSNSLVQHQLANYYAEAMMAQI